MAKNIACPHCNGWTTATEIIKGIWTCDNCGEEVVFYTAMQGRLEKTKD